MLQRLRRTSGTLKNLVKYLMDNAVMRGRVEVARDEAETNPASEEKKPMGQPYQVSNDPATNPAQAGHESITSRLPHNFFASRWRFSGPRLSRSAALTLRRYTLMEVAASTWVALAKLCHLCADTLLVMPLHTQT